MKWSWAAVAVSGVCVILTAVFVALGAGHDTPSGAGSSGPAGATTLELAGFAFAAVGGLLVLRVRDNPIGWVFCLIGAGLSLSIAGGAYANYAVFVASPLLAGARIAVLVDDVAGPPCFGLVGVALLLFPTGRLPSRRWRPALWLCVAGSATIALGYAFRPGGGDEPFQSVTNPLGIHGAFDLLDAMTGLGWLLSGLGVAAAAVAMVRRLRRSTGVERLQLKWIAYAAGILAADIVADEVSFFADVHGVAGIRDMLLGLAFATFPVAAGIAILRHRLYNIDVVIRRTLVYGFLTAMLAAVYIGTVLLLQAALDPVTSGSSVAVAVSTLAVTALFGPARTRVQAVVDRRFYRRKYDAARTVEDFSVRLREQVDLDALGGELRKVVRDTMQPSHVSLWMRGPRS
jgi:hypothetical protein